MDLERGFISKLLETKDMNFVKDEQIRPHFLYGKHKQAYYYIEEYFVESGEVPTLRAFKREFPDYELEKHDGNVGTEEPLQYWCKELRRKKKQNKLALTVEEASGHLNELDTDDAYDLIKQAVMEIEGEVVKSTASDITENVEDRILAYKERKKNEGMLGIPTGWNKLDYLLKGWQKGQLNTLIANTGVGKANTLDTKILTPNGYVEMRDIEVGDLVIGEEGEPVEVTGVYPQGKKEIYELTFDNDAKVKCSKDHLWKFKNKDMYYRNKDWEVDSLENIMNRFKVKRSQDNNLLVPVCKAVDFGREVNLPVDPYLLGVLIGDGYLSGDRICISNPEKDVLDKCNNLFPDKHEFLEQRGDNYSWNVKSESRVNQFNHTIKVKTENKFIPEDYLYASKEKRMSLLKGLMDTDGHVTKKGTFQYFTVNKRLKDQFKFLCGTLGYKTSITEDRRAEKYTSSNVCYRIAVKTDDVIVSSEKHLERLSNVKKGNRKFNNEISYITNIERVGEEECQCIAVDSENHTYVVQDFIVTHNTWVECLIGANAMLQNYRVLQITTEMEVDTMRDRYEAILTSKLVGDINYGRFKAGKLNPEEEERYFDYLRNRAPNMESLIIEETMNGVSFISAKVDQYKPDLVLIDGAYLMEDERQASQDWLRILHITRDLKRLAKLKKVPVFITTQADSNTSKKKGPELGNIGYAKGIGQDSDNVFALFRDEQMIEDKEMMWKVLKQREGTLGQVFLEWDFTTMSFDEIYASYEQEGKTVVDNDETFDEEDKEEMGLVKSDSLGVKEEKKKLNKKKKKKKTVLGGKLKPVGAN
jgi:replicative DNA helicase